MLKVYELAVHAKLEDGTPHVFLDGELVVGERTEFGKVRWVLSDDQVDVARRNHLAPRLVGVRQDPPAAGGDTQGKAVAPVPGPAAEASPAADDLPPGEHLRRVFAEPQAPEPGDASEDPAV